MITNEEYKMIKDEIRYWQNEENKYWIFTYTSIGAILSLALQQNNPLILFGVYVILLASISQLIHVKRNYIFLGCYLATHSSESFKWEEVSNKFKLKQTKFLSNFGVNFRNYSLGIIAVGILLMYIYMNGFEVDKWYIYDYIIVGCLILITLYLGYLLKVYDDEWRLREGLTEDWMETIK